MAQPRPWLSVVLPVRDERDALPGLTVELEKVLDQMSAPWEIVFVDDASRDGSLAWARSRAGRSPRIRVVALDRHRGQASALGAGFAAARGAVIATLDADGQNDPADLPRLLALLSEEVDVVCGVRARRRDAAHRRIVSRCANAVRNRLTGESIDDVGCSLRVMRARYARGVRLERGLHRFLPTLLRLEGARIVETPVSHRPRERGRSKYGLLDRLPEAVRDLWTVRRLLVAARRRGRA
jgi:glycosyltransferase involved in cell wall biosynthesis